ncbi:PaaX family transcriptional regulator C-terminal domain-containing protein [Streptomyces sp. NPDC048291]|uniref:PaaX family transcriptional regulator n=1 Tax=Streptomyces sp. NPDC048291 TaxID=3365530 RepID=UPI0037139858
MSTSIERKAPSSPPPQELVLEFLGLQVLGRAGTVEPRVRPVPAQVFLTVLGALGVSDAAGRAALNRMVTRGLLTRHKQGRTSAFSPTDVTVAMLDRGRRRMFSPTPFEQADGGWTILNCPIPESLRNLRYQLHARLAWSGFGMAQANLWVAPGRIDVEELVGDFFPPDSLGLVQAFHGVPTPPTSPESLVPLAWDLKALRQAHLGFADRWTDEAPASPEEALSRFLLLAEDWGRLLRTDPGLPASEPGEDRPSVRSAQIFRRLDALLGPLAEERLRKLMPLETAS